MEIKYQKIKIENLGGEVKEIYYDKNIKRLNLELCQDNIGIPLIRIEDWTKNKTKILITLHIKEAIELKSIIDNLVFDYNAFSKDKN